MSHLRLTEQQLADRAKRLADGRASHNRVAGPQCPLEHDEQVAVIQWCDLHPVARLIFAIPNGSFKSKAAAGRMKAEGLRSGVPDLFLPVARGGYHGLFCEMKRRNFGALSDTQVAWWETLQAQGFRCIVSHGADAAINAIKEYLDEQA